MTQAATLTHRAACPPSRAPIAGGVKLGLVFATEFRDLARVGALLAARRHGNAVRGLMTIMRCRTPQDLVAARAALLCEDFELVRGGCDRTGEIVSNAAGEAVRAIAPAA